jgi:hypothetical protein
VHMNGPPRGSSEPAQRLTHRPRLHPRGDGIHARYWKPVWHVLEASVELVLANTMHIRNIPGRKSDVNDATWLADLLAHGLIWEGARADDSPVGAAAGGSADRIACSTNAANSCVLPSASPGARCLHTTERSTRSAPGSTPGPASATWSWGCIVRARDRFGHPYLLMFVVERPWSAPRLLHESDTGEDHRGMPTQC